MDQIIKNINIEVNMKSNEIADNPAQSRLHANIMSNKNRQGIII